MTSFKFTSIPFSTAFLPDTKSDTRAIATPIGAVANKIPTNAIETQTKGIYNFHRAEQSHTLEELQQHPVFGQLWQVPQPDNPSPLETTRNHRLAILARRFEGADLTREDEARLAILTQRLRRLVPRVTTKAWTIAEETLAQLEGISSRIDEIDARFGL